LLCKIISEKNFYFMKYLFDILGNFVIKYGYAYRFRFFSLYRTAYGPLYEPGDQIWIQLPIRTKLGAYWDGLYQVQKNWIGTRTE
ncbi:hypothetical protein T4C_1416, partial [Trichinella pseudospiralis]